jgi:hypothetical protein
VHIFASYAQQMIAECDWCKGPMPSGTPVMRGLSYYRGRRYPRYWHWKRDEGGNCYLEQTEQWFNDNPFKSSYPGGRTAMKLTSEQRVKRRSLITMGSQLKKAKENAVRHGYMTQAQDIDNKIRNIALRFDNCGGIPASKFWRNIRP